MATNISNGPQSHCVPDLTGYVQYLHTPDLGAKMTASKFNTTLPVEIPVPDCSSFTPQIFKVLGSLAEKTRDRYENIA